MKNLTTFRLAKAKVFVPLHAGPTESRSSIARKNSKKSAVNQSQPPEISHGPSLDELLLRAEWGNFIVTQIHDYFVQTRTAFAASCDFDFDGGWPTKILRNERMRVLGSVLIKPPHWVLKGMLDAGCSEEEVQARAQNMIQSCSPLTADVIDLLMFLLHDPRNSQGASFSIDAILSARGLQKHRGGRNLKLRSSGERKTKMHTERVYSGGYSSKQRQRVEQQIELLSWLHLSPASGTVTPLFEFIRLPNNKEHAKNAMWALAPSDFLKSLFAEGDSAWLPRVILGYDPIREALEKRLGRYIVSVSHQTADRFIDPRTQDLLKICGLRLARHPSEIAARFADCLDRLKRDGIIRGWDYDWKSVSIPNLNGLAKAKYFAERLPGWQKYWLQARVEIQLTDCFNPDAAAD